jgi:hypothetical protein
LIDMTVIICKSLAAFDIGYCSCYLRIVQQRAWAKSDDDRVPITPFLGMISRRLLAVIQGLDPLQGPLFKRLMAEAKRHHRQALQYRDHLLAELVEEVGDASEARSQLPGRVEEWATDLRKEQEQDWEAITLFTLRCVEADPQLTAWWKLGFAIASRAFRPDTEKTILVHHEDPSDELWWAAERLSESERVWVKEFLPAEFEANVDGNFRLLRAYHDIRASLPQMDRQQGRSSVERLFRHNEDFSKCWWVRVGDFENDDTERVVLRRLFEDKEGGGQGVELDALLAGTRRSLLTRLDAVFLHGSRERRRYNPAWEHGLIENVYPGKYRLNLQGHKRTHRDASPRTDQ